MVGHCLLSFVTNLDQNTFMRFGHVFVCKELFDMKAFVSINLAGLLLGLQAQKLS